MTMFGSQWLANAGSTYEIEQSIRFDKTTSSHLSNTYGSAGNRKTWTFSTWFKRGKIDGTRQSLFAATGPAYLQVGPDAASREMITILNEGSGTDLNWYTTQVFRDPAAWYHLVWQFDTTQADADNRTKLYINGSQVTDFTKAATPAQDFEGAINNAVEHKIGELHIANFYFDGYQAEINFIDGTALAPTAFGEYNNDGVWIPKKYSGAYGTNGFFIDGRDSSDLGDDESGNGNDFASSGLAAADQMSDTPTKNFCTMNPLDAPTGSITLSNGNLDLNQSSFNKVRGTIAFDVQDDDGFYFEVKKTNGNFRSAGIVATDASNFASAQSLLSVNPSVVYYMEGGEVNQNGSQILASLPTFATNDVLGVAVRNGKVYFAKNNTWVNSGDPVNETGQVASITGSSPLYSPAVGEQNNQSGITNTVNFGATAFAHTPPTGYKALNTANLATPTIADGSAYFQPVLYTGSTSAQDITFSGNSDLAPDWLWFKARNASSNHFLFDKVRGALKTISSDRTAAEATSTGSMTAFGTDGFSLGDGGSANDINGVSGTTYVAWGWAANGAGSSNEDGSINTTATSANTTAGFSISTYTGTGSNATVGHGLGIAPSLVIIKSRNDTHDWYVRTPALSGTEFLILNTIAAKGTASPEVWNSTAPTSSVVNIGTSIGVNRSSYNYVMYCFAEIPGYCSIGTYTGNGSTDGPFIYTGFKPAFVLFKKFSATDGWEIFDSKRPGYNVTGLGLIANSSAAEVTGRNIDILSNGIKQRNGNGTTNENGNSYIYMAFAENPFGGDGVAPATAR